MSAVAPKVSELKDQATRAARCQQIAEWLPTFSDNGRSLFARIIESHPSKHFSGTVKRYEDLQLDKLEVLYNLCRRTAIADRLRGLADAPPRIPPQAPAHSELEPDERAR